LDSLVFSKQREKYLPPALLTGLLGGDCGFWLCNFFRLTADVLSKNSEGISVRSDTRYRAKINLNSILIITVLMLPLFYKKLEMRFFYCAYDANLKIPQAFTLPNTIFLGLVTIRKLALGTKRKT